MKAKIILTASLRAVLEKKPEVVEHEINQPMSIRRLLIETGINPLIVMKVFVDGIQRSKEDLLDRDVEIVLMGPVSGG
ncbi:MAG: hypothetical protein R6V46_02845 [Desulfatiglandaceae bacterium]